MAITKTLAEYAQSTIDLLYDLLTLVAATVPMAVQAKELYVGNVPWIIYDLLVAFDASSGGGGGIGSALKAALGTGDGDTTVVFADLVGVAQARIKMVVVGNTIYRFTGDGAEISGYVSGTGTITFVANIENLQPCIALYTAS